MAQNPGQPTPETSQALSALKLPSTALTPPLRF